MAREGTKALEFDNLLESPFSRMERMVEGGPVERCDRMLEQLDQLEKELTHIIDVALVIAASDMVDD